MSRGPVFHGFSSMAERSVGRKGFLISERPSLESETKPSSRIEMSAVLLDPRVRADRGRVDFICAMFIVSLCLRNDWSNGGRFWSFRRYL
jgi:hypothetical protein